MAEIDGGLLHFCVIENVLYALSMTFHVFKYNPIADKWTLCGLPFDGTKDETGAMFVAAQKKLYVIGGRNEKFGAKCFDFETGSWLTLANPSVNRNCLRLVACNGFIYAFGGNVAGGKWSKIIEKYFPKANVWATVSRL